MDLRVICDYIYIYIFMSYVYPFWILEIGLLGGFGSTVPGRLILHLEQLALDNGMELPTSNVAGREVSGDESDGDWVKCA